MNLILCDTDFKTRRSNNNNITQKLLDVLLLDMYKFSCDMYRLYCCIRDNSDAMCLRSLVHNDDSQTQMLI